MNMFLQKVLAYSKKSFLIMSSYRFAFFFGIFGAIFHLLIFFFIDKLFGSQIAPHLSPFGINYFSYAIVGIIFFTFIGTAMGTVASQIQSEQMMGTLETLLLTPTQLYTLVTTMVIWNLIYALIELVMYVILGIFLFKVDFSNINLFSTAVITILSIISFNSLGIISASFIIVFKRGDPVSWLMNIAVGVLGGVYFPIKVLPDWLQYLAHLLPVTYAIRSVELAIHQGAGLRMLLPDVAILFGFSIILVPLGLLSLKYALRKAKEAGSLVQY